VVRSLHHRSLSGGSGVHEGLRGGREVKHPGGKSVSAEVVPAFLLEHPMIWLVPSFAFNLFITVLWFWLQVFLWGKLLRGLDLFVWIAIGE